MAGILQSFIRSGFLDTRRIIRVQALSRAFLSFNGVSGDDQDEELHPQWRCVFVTIPFTMPEEVDRLSPLSVGTRGWDWVLIASGCSVCVSRVLRTN